MNWLKIAIIFQISTLVLSACNNKEKNNIENVKKRYSKEVFNYFYETAFFSEKIKHLPNSTTYKKNITKWNNDIYLFVEGDSNYKYTGIVKQVVGELNALKLPVKLYIIENRKNANCHIHFGSYEQLNLKKDVIGFGIDSISSNGYVYKSLIKIPISTNKSSIPKKLKSTILEEITQTLGLLADSYSYPSSIFYQKSKYVQHLSDIDKKTLELLYEPAIPPNYTLKQYEKDFADQLYHINSKKKLYKYIKRNQYGKESIVNILESGGVIEDPNISKKVVIKFNPPTNVFISGNVLPEFLNIFENAIECLNSVSKNIQLTVTNKDSLTHKEGIYFDFARDTTIEEIKARFQFDYLLGLRFPARGKAKVNIVYKNHEQLIEVMNKVIPDFLYKSLCLTETDIPSNVFTIKNDTFHLKPEYRKILKIYYSNALPNGFTKEDLEWVLEKLESEEPL